MNGRRLRKLQSSMDEKTSRNLQRFLDEKALRDMYLDLLSSALRNTFYKEPIPAPQPVDLQHAEQLIRGVEAKLGRHGILTEPDLPTRIYYTLKGNRPNAHVMGDEASLNNVRLCVESVIHDQIPGDLIEAGVFRGGQTIFMRGILKSYGITDRVVYVADSFEGLPAPDPDVSLADAVAHEILKEVDSLKTGLEMVQENFRRYGLLDAQVKFLKGWFSETLPNCQAQRFSVIRLDGDWYESTKVAIESLYPKLSRGGFIIIDDYHLPVGARQAVDNYRHQFGIRDKLTRYDTQGVFWRKSSS
jgi:O-methyltransferase